jgi:tRNA (guanine-N1)-methyltransferase
MWFGVVSLFPEMFRTATASGVLGRAVTQGVLEVELFNPRDYTADRHRTVDDRPYGGGPGMVMMAPPLLAAIAAARQAGGSALAPRTPAGQVAAGHLSVTSGAAVGPGAGGRAGRGAGAGAGGGPL